MKALSDARSFSLFATVDAKQNLGPNKTRFHRPNRLVTTTKEKTFSNIKLWKGGMLDSRDFNRDCRICFDKGVFYLMVTRTVCKEYERDDTPSEMCALDPGVRRFLTGYSPQGDAFVVGVNTYTVLDRCIRRIDTAKARYTGLKKTQLAHPEDSKMRKKVQHSRRRYHKAETKAKNVIKDMHYKSAHFLCRSFDTIFFPTFSSHAIVQGKLNKSVKRRLNMLSFYKFRTRLVETASLYPSVTIKSGSEAYTSKQCGKCGFLNDGLGSNIEFHCPECGSVADRDVHAARNILLRHLQRCHGA